MNKLYGFLIAALGFSAFPFAASHADDAGKNIVNVNMGDKLTWGYSLDKLSSNTLKITFDGTSLTFSGDGNAVTKTATEVQSITFSNEMVTATPKKLPTTLYALEDIKVIEAGKFLAIKELKQNEEDSTVTALVDELSKADFIAQGSTCIIEGAFEYRGLYFPDDNGYSATTLDGGLLQGATSSAIPAIANCYIYTLQSGTFKKFTGTKFTPGKCFLPVPKDLFPEEEEASARNIKFVFEYDNNSATNIKNVNINSINKGIFDLQGRKVINPIRGHIYIVNGKKQIIK